MPIPSSGTISIATIVGEFGGSAPHAMSEYYRGGGLVSTNNTNVPASGRISINNFRGAVRQFSFNITGSYSTPQNLRTLALNAGWNGTDYLVVTNNAVISSNTTGTAALTINGSYPNGLLFINNSTIVGMGGAGGNYGQPGGAGGAALAISSAVSIDNRGNFAGGGGGGGSSPLFGWSGVDLTTTGGAGASGLTQSFAGSGGGWGGNNSSFNGTFWNIPGGGNTACWAGVCNSPSGAGGTWGTAGSSGGYAGGAAGAAVSGNSFVTWIATGTRLGSLT